MQLTGKVVLDQLRKEFGRTLAVDDLTLAIEDRTFVSILGPSGCGKTTTLNMIVGLLTPTSGKVFIDDNDVTDLSPAERKVGLMFQDYAVFPTKTGYGNIAYGLKIRKTPQDIIDKEVKEVAALVNIDDVLDRKPGQMNQSELQRVALARALVVKPSILLLDEPLSNLDASLRIRMRTELKHLQKELTQTVIYVTHDQIEAMALSDKIAVMHMGKLQQYGTPEEVYERPSNKFVGGFIGTPPLNFIDCSFEEKADGKAFLRHGDLKLDVTKLKNEIKQGSSGSEVILGFRAEHVRIAHKPTGDHSTEVTVLTSEPIGSEVILNVTIDDVYLRIVAPPFFEAQTGDKLYVQFDMNKIHVMDRKTEQAIV